MQYVQRTKRVGDHSPYLSSLCALRTQGIVRKGLTHPHTLVRFCFYEPVRQAMVSYHGIHAYRGRK